MKHARTVFTVPVLVLFSAAAANLRHEDRKEGLAHLERTLQGVVEATRGLSPAQWTFKPAPDRWSVAEVLEHIVVAEDMLFEMVSEKVMRSPARRGERDNKATDEKVLNAISDRSNRVQAPDVVAPAGRWPPVETLDRFVKSRERTMRFLESTQSLREHAGDSPLGEPLDAFQWILYISAHSERHTKQILEVKADSNFPK